MLINLIKLFQSAAERSTFKQACGLNNARLRGRPGSLSASLLNTTTSQHGYCTSQEQAPAETPRKQEWVSHAPNAKAAPGIPSLGYHCLAQPSFTSASLPWV